MHRRLAAIDRVQPSSRDNHHYRIRGRADVVDSELLRIDIRYARISKDFL